MDAVVRERFEAGRGFARKLALAFCRRRGLRGLDAEELHAQALEGLWEAAERFEPERGVPFGAFAQLRIRGRMMDSLRERDRGQDRKARVGFVSLDYEAADGRRIEVAGREPEPWAALEAGEEPPAWSAVPAGARWLLRLTVLEGWSLREAGLLHGLSESRACQIRQAAVAQAAVAFRR